MSDSNLRWATKEKNISNPSKYQYSNQNFLYFFLFYYFFFINYLGHLSQVKALIYGKATDTLLKNYNKNLEFHLCFSLILQTRSLDFYCTNEQIDNWVMALSAEIRKRNPNSYTLTPGKFLWRKMKLILINSLTRDPKYKNLKYHTFVKGIIAYRNILCQNNPKQTVLTGNNKK